MKHFYEVEQTENAANEQCGEETDEDNHHHHQNHNQLARKDSKNQKNCLLNQLFLHSATTESSLVLASSNGLHRDQIPLLYQAQFNHRKSIANLELTQADSDFHFEKHKLNMNRSEHDLSLFQQQQLGNLLTNGIENVIPCAIRTSLDANLDRVSTISN
jgi:hypothetical protein